MTWLTVPEAAERLRKSERFVKDEIRRKNLRASKWGGAWHVSETDLETYQSAHANVRAVGRSA